MNVVSSDGTVVFFRNQSDFCLDVSHVMKKSGLDFIEIITDSTNFQEMPCIFSPKYASAFRGETGVLKFLSLIKTESAQMFTHAYA